MPSQKERWNIQGLYHIAATEETMRTEQEGGRERRTHRSNEKSEEEEVVKAREGNGQMCWIC